MTHALRRAADILNREKADLADEIERLRIPICIGKPIIGILAREGAWKSENGNAVIAADELFRADPYDEIARLRAERDELLRALRLEPTLTDEQREELSTGYGAILHPIDVFNLGWRTGLTAARAAIAKAEGGK